MEEKTLIGQRLDAATQAVSAMGMACLVEQIRPQGNKHADWTGEWRVVRAVYRDGEVTLTAAPFLPGL